MLSIINNPETMLLPTSNGISVINTATIIRVQSISNYSKIFFNDGRTLVVAKLLSWFENKFSKELFVRIHRSHLVNMQHVRGYSSTKNSMIILPDNTMIAISRRKKGAVLKLFRKTQAA